MPLRLSASSQPKYSMANAVVSLIIARNCAHTSSLVRVACVVAGVVLVDAVFIVIVVVAGLVVGVVVVVAAAAVGGCDGGASGGSW